MLSTRSTLTRRLAAAAVLATLAAGAATASPAAAEPNFGAGNLPPMTMSEGAIVDYAASFPACPAEYQCVVSSSATGGQALPGSDFVAYPERTQFLRAADGPMVVVLPLRAVQDRQYERDESFFANVLIEYYRGPCVRPTITSVCAPESAFRWSGIVTIEDDDALISRSNTLAKGPFITRK